MTHVAVRANGRTGLPDALAEEFHAIIVRQIRMTRLAKEALQEAGATVALISSDPEVYCVTIQIIPPGIVPNADELGRVALRMEHEPDWPFPDFVSWWDRIAWQPCPECGHALAWYEAGYVPGYRICCGPDHHHCETVDL